MGADVNSDSAVMVVIDGKGRLTDGLPGELTPSNEADVASRLAEFLERFTQHLQAVRPGLVVLVDVNLARATPTNIKDQAYLEACILLASRRLGVSTRRVHQRGVALGLGLRAAAKKAEIRQAVASLLGDTALLSPNPDRRARALGAVWVASETTPS